MQAAGMSCSMPADTVHHTRNEQNDGMRGTGHLALIAATSGRPSEVGWCQWGGALMAQTGVLLRASLRGARGAGQA